MQPVDPAALHVVGEMELCGLIKLGKKKKRKNGRHAHIGNFF